MKLAVVKEARAGERRVAQVWSLAWSKQGWTCASRWGRVKGRSSPMRPTKRPVPG
jgi:hypothetical protein